MKKKHLLFGIFFLCCILYPMASENQRLESTEELQQADFFSLGLFSSTDSVKTTVNLEAGFTVYRKNNFQIRSLTAITGSKIFADEPNLYQLGLMEKITFGQIDYYKDAITSSRYGFFFTSFGFMAFDKNKEEKFLFAKPYYWEIGGGAGVNIRLSKGVAFLGEMGGGLHVVTEEDFWKKLKKAGFGRMSLGLRYFLGNKKS